MNGGRQLMSRAYIVRKQVEAFQEVLVEDLVSQPA